MHIFRLNLYILYIYIFYIIAGDFNIKLLKINEKEVVGEFFDILISCSYYLHVTLPTRFSNKNRTLIDNLFCNITDSAIKPE